MSRLFTLVLLVAVSPPLSAQPVDVQEFVYGGGWGGRLYAAASTAEAGGFAVGGSFVADDESWQDAYIQIHGSGGNSLTAIWGEAEWDEVRHLAALPAGGLVATGAARGLGWGELYDVMLARFSTEGELLWTTTEGGPGTDTGVRLFADDTGILVAAITREEEDGRCDYSLLRFSLGGELLWQQVYGGEENDLVQTAVRLADGSVWLGGYTHSFGAESQNLYLVHASADGTMLAEVLLQTPLPLVPWGMEVVDDTLFVCATGYLENGTELPHPELLAFSLEGELMWRRSYPNTVAEPRAILRLGQRLLLAGFAHGDDGPDAWLAGVSPAGELLWERQYGGPDWDQFDALVADGPNRVQLVGFTVDGAGHTRSYRVAAQFQPVHAPEEPGDRGDTQAPSLTVTSPNLGPAGHHLALTLSRPGSVGLVLYNALGQRVITLANGALAAGTHQYTLPNARLSSGVYFVHLAVSGWPVQTRRVLVIH